MRAMHCETCLYLVRMRMEGPQTPWCRQGKAVPGPSAAAGLRVVMLGWH